MTLPIRIALAIILFLSIQLKAQDNVVDKVVAYVGNHIILMSDIENQYMQFLMQGSVKTDGIKCQILEEMLFQKLMLNQAEIDSVKITENQVESEMDRRLRYFISQIGSEQKLEEYYGKSIMQIKDELRSRVKDQMLVEQVQKKITDNIKVTPSEVKAFYKSIPEDSIPLINSELEIAQIVRYPEISPEEKEIFRQKAEGLRNRAVKGENFAVLARMYSEDPGSASKGGELGMFGRGEMTPEFEAAAFALKQKDEISPVIETPFGYHVLQLIERRGDYVNVRHILIQTTASPLAQLKARAFLDSVAKLIKADSITFEKAAEKFSQANSKNNGGLIINPQTGNTRFEPDQLDQNVFFTVEKLQPGQISAPIAARTDDNKQAFQILCLKSRTKPHKANLKEDYNYIQELALKDKQNKAIDKWIKEKSKDVYIYIVDESYRRCKFQFNWVQ